MGSPITSIYFDTPEFYCYKTRMEKHEGASLIRIRWYGNEKPKEGEEVFVERKLHHESWVREQSTKVRRERHRHFFFFEVFCSDLASYL